ncbi:MAG TPA: TPM domain-containing protein [Candidatus Limnocylindria bacterium]
MRLLLIALLSFAMATSAFGDDIPRLGGQLTDRSNAQVLTSGTSAIQTALNDLLIKDDVQLFVLFVETTGSRNVTDFATEVATQNSLGGNDALLVVALTDRSDAVWLSDYLSRITNDEAETVLTQQLEPRLRSGDYAGAVIAAIGGIGAASRAGAASAAPTTRPSPSVDLGWLNGVVLVVVAGAVVFTIFTVVRRRRTEAMTEHARDAKRAEEANALLIRADESLRDAQQEMGYAEAQFTPDDVAPYRDAVAAAATELKAAFTARQQLDDAVPEDPGTRRALVEEIVTRATKALSLLEEQRKRVDEMRELEKRAPELLVELKRQIAGAAARLPDAERTVDGFGRYAAQSWSSVKTNVADARDLLARATAHVADGDAATQTGDAAGAAKAVREAQQDQSEAVRLTDAIATVAATIAEAQRTAREHLAAASADIDKASATLAHGSTAERAQRLAAARAALASAESALSSPTPDYLAAVKLATEAGTGAGAVLAEVKQEEEKREREARVAAAQLQVARDAYRRAEDFIAPRRRTIGSTARTRLAEAERHLGNAQQQVDASDHASGLREAQQAQRLAEEALSLAHGDVDEAESRGPWTGFPRGGPVFIPFPFPIGGGHGGGGGFHPPISIPLPGGRSIGGRW